MLFIIFKLKIKYLINSLFNSLKKYELTYQTNLTLKAQLLY